MAKITIQRGGVRIGALWAALWLPWPCARLVCSPERLVISILGFQFRLPRREVAAVTCGKSLFSTGFLFEHTFPTAPRLAFYTSRPDELAAALKQCGYALYRSF